MKRKETSSPGSCRRVVIAWTMCQLESFEESQAVRGREGGEKKAAKGA